MRFRPEIAELLAQGLSNRAIADVLHVCADTVAAHRKALGLPNCRPGRKAALSLEELFWGRAEPVEGGHLRWTGHVNNTGTPVLRYEKKIHSAYRVAFTLHSRRQPEGIVTSDCGFEGCVEPRHMEDDITRTRVRAAYAAVIGRRTRGDRCRRGHSAATFRRYTRDGGAYCFACNTPALRVAGSEGTGS
ncbi:LuxR C-terminal-related transcriptional regulator [Streptomyces triculaminicus]|uniref:LuxR C-terminal-related transcriptional regulator n=1 Tax=Streptomyces triculaminicus TaxID=2816232 RepID=UPI0037A1FF28